MLQDSETLEKQAVLTTAALMCAAARTAPKARGIDNIVTAVIEGATKEKLAQVMEQIYTETGAAFFQRDAQNVRQAIAVVLLGTRFVPAGIPGCGLCGNGDCAATAAKGAPCVFNTGDLGIAVGSAVSVAADHRIDNRVMHSVGRAAVRLGLLGDDVKIVYGIPLSVSGKSIFFDRK